jgi:UDP-GlcNAc:undecaprenyl-phosphate/decaprenyl-phosphate GlcNAc-1-phosphate transferase
VSLYTGRWMWISLGAMSALTITMTFVLPVMRRPAMLDRDATSEPTR